jgi:hypothetical protein
MSYTITITRNDIPGNDDVAWEYVQELIETDSGEPSDDFVNLLEKLMEKYPCICDDDADEDAELIWSDGPLIDNAGENVTTLGLSSGIDDAIPYIVKVANELGFVVFDEQEEKIYRP